MKVVKTVIKVIRKTLALIIGIFMQGLVFYAALADMAGDAKVWMNKIAEVLNPIYYGVFDWLIEICELQSLGYDVNTMYDLFTLIGILSFVILIWPVCLLAGKLSAPAAMLSGLFPIIMSVATCLSFFGLLVGPAVWAGILGFMIMFAPIVPVIYAVVKGK